MVIYLQGSLKNKYIESSIALPNLDKKSNSFRIFTRMLGTIYGQNTVEIEIGREHLGRFLP
jgi:hypothetical protein